DDAGQPPASRVSYCRDLVDVDAEANHPGRVPVSAGGALVKRRPDTGGGARSGVVVNDPGARCSRERDRRFFDLLRGLGLAGGDGAARLLDGGAHCRAEILVPGGTLDALPVSLCCGRMIRHSGYVSLVWRELSSTPPSSRRGPSRRSLRGGSRTAG